MSILQDLLALNESKRPKPTKGWIAIVDPEGAFDTDGIYAFKQEADADAFFKGLDAELAGSDAFATNDVVLDGFHFVMHFDHRVDPDDVSFIGFATSKEALEQSLIDSVESGDIYGVDQIEDIDFIETND